MEVLPLTIRKIIEPLTHFIVENEKEARRFIKRIAPQKKQDQLVLYPLNKFTDPHGIAKLPRSTSSGTIYGITF